MRIQELVRAARKTRGLSQREAAARAGVPQSTIARIELGAIEPRADTVERVLTALGHDLTMDARAGEGIDRTLIQHFLQMSPQERIAYGAAAGMAVQRLNELVRGQR